MAKNHTLETSRQWKNDLRKNEKLQSDEYQCFDFYFTTCRKLEISQMYKKGAFLDSFEKNQYFCTLKCPDNQRMDYPDFRKSA